MLALVDSRVLGLGILPTTGGVLDLFLELGIGALSCAVLEETPNDEGTAPELELASGRGGNCTKPKEAGDGSSIKCSVGKNSGPRTRMTSFLLTLLKLHSPVKVSVKNRTFKSTIGFGFGGMPI
jgi:hypothetical protein